MKRFLKWLASLSVIMRCLVIALVFHLAVLLLLGAIKIVPQLPKLVGIETVIDEPPPLPPTDDPPVTPPTTPPGGNLIGCGVLQMGTPTIGPTTGGGSVIARVTETGGRWSNTGLGTGSGVGDGIGKGTSWIGTGIPDGKPWRPSVASFGTNRPTGLTPPKDPELDRHVLAGLRWLAKNQNPDDGTWKCGPSKAAGTALATLAFLGHGETPDRGEFSGHVNAACLYLVSCIGEDGFVKDKNMYAQGAVTLALAEAYGLTRNPNIKAALERAVAANLAAQKITKNPAHQGGWRYALTSTDSDTSVSGWIIMSLKTAKMAGIEIPAEAFDDASKYLWQTYSAEGGFGYAGPQRSVNMTGVGVLCQQFLGHGRDPRLKKALDYLKEQKLEWSSTDASWPLYGWYYITQAMFQAGGTHWEYWQRQFRQTLFEAQANDGHWDPPPNGKSDPRDPAYATALCCLMLEVYYRYAPVDRPTGLALK